MKKALLSGICLLAAITMQAQDKKEPPEMETDRPGLTEAASVVPKGFVQAECGFVWAQDKQDGVIEREYLYPATILRIGVFGFAELRLKGELKKEVEEIAATDVKTEKIGFAKTGLGLKVQLWQARGARPAAVLLAHTIVPWGSKSYNAKLVEPDLLLAFANDLSDKIEISYSIGGMFESHKPEATESDPRKYDHIYFYTFQVTDRVSDQVQIFVEYNGKKQEDQRFVHVLDTGIAWKLRPNLQLDLLGGLGLTKDAPDVFMETGVSFRLPR